MPAILEESQAENETTFDMQHGSQIDVTKDEYARAAGQDHSAGSPRSSRVSELVKFFDKSGAEDISLN